MTIAPSLRKPLLLALFAIVAGWLLAPGALRFGTGKTLSAFAAEPLRTLQGRPVVLTTLAAGRPMVVNLWASWCPPCRREMPLLAKAQAQRSDVAFVFANQGESSLLIDAYLAAEPMTLANVLLDPGKSLGRNAGSTALPITLFFDGDGRLLFSHLGEISERSLNDRLATWHASHPDSPSRIGQSGR